jgi:hypothetical protein
MAPTEIAIDAKPLKANKVHNERNRKRAERMKLYRKSFSVSRLLCERDRSRARCKKAREVNRITGKKDPNAAERSKLYRYKHKSICTYPPCNKIKRVDGVWHFAKYCPHLFPDGRRLMMEELKRKGECTGDFLPVMRLGYYDSWDRACVKEKWTKDFYSPPYLDLDNKRRTVGLDEDGRVSIWDGAESDAWESNDEEVAAL